MNSPRSSVRFNTPQPATPLAQRSTHSTPSSQTSRRSSRVHFSPPPALEVFTDDNDGDNQQNPSSLFSPGPESLAGGGCYLAVYGKSGSLGYMVYSMAENKFHYIQDQRDTPDWQFLNSILSHTQPVKVWASIASDLSFGQALRKFMNEVKREEQVSGSRAGDDSSAVDDDDRVEFIVGREFNHFAGKDALQQLILVEPGHYQPQQEERPQGENEEDYFDRLRRLKEAEIERAKGGTGLRMQALTSSLEGCNLTLGCAAVLISNVRALLRSRGAAAVAGDEFKIAGLGVLTLDGNMIVTFETLTALNIFKPEAHGSYSNRESKEGASLFGMMDTCKTPLGKLLFRDWFLRPSLHLGTIRNRQNAIECLLKSENSAKLSKLMQELKMIRNAPALVRLVEDDRATLVNWKSLYNFAHAAMAIRATVEKNINQRENIAVFDRILDQVDQKAIEEVGLMIHSVIDFNASQGQAHLVVNSGLSKRLDDFRHTRDSIPALLTQLAGNLREELPPALGDTIQMVYYPQMGYLVSIEWTAESGDINDALADTGLVHHFNTETVAFLKNDICRGLDNNVGDIANLCRDEEIKILGELSNSVIANAEAVAYACSAIAELDCIVALTVAARDKSWIKPNVVPESVIKIKKGTHPIVEKYVHDFVKNDTIIVAGHGCDSAFDRARERNPDELLSGEDSVMIVTGANYSGKSVYLKQVAVLTFLAHVGSFIPAERATIGLTDQILAKLVTRESITKSESAFMIDLNTISFILRNATPRSLVILDEIGKGTTAHDGAGVFSGVVTELLNRGDATPRTLVATHYQTVFRHGLLSQELPIGIASMQVHVPHDEEQRSDEPTGKRLKPSEPTSRRITYLYTLAPGLAASSCAGACALLHGIEQDVVDEAAEVTKYLNQFELDQFLLDHPADDGRQDDYENGEKTARRLLLFEKEEHPIEGDETSEEEVNKALRLVSAILDGEVEGWEE